MFLVHLTDLPDVACLLALHALVETPLLDQLYLRVHICQYGLEHFCTEPKTLPVRILLILKGHKPLYLLYIRPLFVAHSRYLLFVYGKLVLLLAPLLVEPLNSLLLILNPLCRHGLVDALLFNVLLFVNLLLNRIVDDQVLFLKKRLAV